MKEKKETKDEIQSNTAFLVGPGPYLPDLNDTEFSSSQMAN